ncbi:hypothetical protein [Winogradskyella sp.]|uniref:hypothetical protein n=1 Tax=Winogradskyella sp. TaxID=1883156 RepID=UPI00261D6C7E|nr:hypothetical protein [Winogradskyella sp.]
MKTRIFIFLLLSVFSCRNFNDKNDENSVTNKSAIDDKKEITNCSRHKSHFDSIPYEEKLDFKVSFDIIKCQLTKKINLNKYNYAELLSKYNYKEYSIYLYRLNCIAGGGCGDYLMSVINRSLEVTESKIIASEISEGENNITVTNFKFNKGKFSFEISSEYYSEELDDYVESSKSESYLVTDLGQIQTSN